MRQSPTARQSPDRGDAAVGHFHVPHGIPLTEEAPHHAIRMLRAFEGASKSDATQFTSNMISMAAACERRGSWRGRFPLYHSLSGRRFGGPVLKDLVPAGRRRALPRRRHGACLRWRRPSVEAQLRPCQRSGRGHFAALDNRRARQQLFNVCMKPADRYGEVPPLSTRHAALTL